MRLINRLWIILILMLCAGCNLSKTEVADLPTVPPSITEAVTPHLTRTPIPFGTTVLPTLLPLPGNIVGIVVNTPQATLIPVTSAPPLGTVCQVYTAYSGVAPQNTLSLRTSGSITAPQVFRVPTNSQVLLVPSSQEVEGDGYHWLNVIYVDPSQTRYQGWMARDSFSTNGVRDPSIATLRPTGASAGC
ncbi:MAG: hypothetical protein ABI970_07100 [Chloroflexota bacterium]